MSKAKERSWAPQVTAPPPPPSWGGGASIKTALAWQGRIEEAFRLPMAPMRPETRLQWRNLLASQGLLPETMTTPLRATA